MASVFEKLRKATALLNEVVSELEPGALDVNGAKRLVDQFTRCERLAVAGRGMAARRVEEAVSWKRDGHRSAAHWLASTTGVSVASAARSLQTARDLETLPETADAFRDGELSEQQAGEIAAAASVDPSAEHKLLDSARSGASFRGLRDECRETAARAADDQRWAQRLHETRAVHTWDERNGHYRIDARISPDEGAWVESALQLKTDELFTAARKAGRREPRAAYMADALLALLRGEAPVKPFEARLDADLAAIERGYVEPGERCELAGIGPIPVTMARALLHDARVTLLGRNGTDITNVSSPTRTIPERLRRWVERAYPRCGVAGCDVDRFLQIDHIVGVGLRGPTSKDNIWRLCGHHHKLKTHYGWEVVTDEHGVRHLVPPEGPEQPP